MKRRGFLQAGFGLAIGTPLLAALRQSNPDAAARVLKEACDSGQVDAAALYVRQGLSEFAAAFGAASSTDAIFLLASISKPITIAAVMTLFDEGAFRLTDPVNRFIPEFTRDGREQITMQQLFTHNSGLPDQLPENAKLRAAHADLSEFTAGAIRTPLLFAPGTKYGYSSMGILLASEVARRISRQPISELVNDRICRPLQLNRSALGTGRFRMDDLMRCQVENAAPESGSGDSTAKDWDWNSVYWRRLGVPWGGAHGSAPDVGRFLNAFLHPQGQALRPETARLMIRNHNPPGMRQRGLGFDLNVGRPNGSGQVFGHTGSTGTLCWADLTSDTVCVVLTTLPARAVQPHPRDVASQHVIGPMEQ